ncbi:hypothetical protein BKA24_002398 [Microbacterium marinum]|uniref:Uncharacterized protein n=1 Tax=Microbacterium marinum TaxID=421115 RepID=A0A7W7FLS3_9MICO|nr:hypothetical protein [Microbacterium marinum]
MLDRMRSVTETVLDAMAMRVRTRSVTETAPTDSATLIVPTARGTVPTRSVTGTVRTRSVTEIVPTRSVTLVAPAATEIVRTRSVRATVLAAMAMRVRTRSGMGIVRT